MLGSRPELEALWAALLVAPNADVKLAYAANMTALAHATASADSVLHTFEDLEKRNRERAPAARFFQFVGTPSPTSPGQQPDTVNFQTLVNWATTADNDLTNPAANSPGAHDMTQPLGHYWISTSHNTYLEGDQVRRRAAVAGFPAPPHPTAPLTPPPRPPAPLRVHRPTLRRRPLRRVPVRRARLLGRRGQKQRRADHLPRVRVTALLQLLLLLLRLFYCT